MREHILQKIDLVCPLCRRIESGRLVQSTLFLADVLHKDQDYIIEGFLKCEDARCGAHYPIIRGVPVILKKLDSWWESEKRYFSIPNAQSSEIKEFLERLGYKAFEHLEDRQKLGTYMDAHYGVKEPPQSIGSINGKDFWENIVSLLSTGINNSTEVSLDIGCSVGRGTFELGKVSDFAVGIDINYQMVAVAAEIQRQHNFAYEHKTHGRFFKKIQSNYEPSDNILFLVADAMDPPFKAATFDLIAAFNVIDNVKYPLTLLGQIDALLRQNGILLLSSPYEWRKDICEMNEWLENANLDSPEFLRNVLKGALVQDMNLHYEIMHEEHDVPWVLRHHKRYWSMFLVHILRAKKLH